MGVSQRRARVQKAQARAQAQPRRTTGVVVEVVDATHVRVDVGEKVVPVVAPAGMSAAAAVGAKVSLLLGNVPVVESVLAAGDPVTIATTTPAGVAVLRRVGSGLASFQWQTNSGVTVAAGAAVTPLTLPTEWLPAVDWALAVSVGTPPTREGGGLMDTAGLVTIRNNYSVDGRTLASAIYPLA